MIAPRSTVAVSTGNCATGRNLVDTLEQDPAKIEAWLGVLKVTDARDYVRKLTPVLLRADTRVTTHEYRSGSVVPVQSVLESGTVVLVDDRGTPKVRCARGTPLTASGADTDSRSDGRRLGRTGPEAAVRRRARRDRCRS